MIYILLFITCNDYGLLGTSMFQNIIAYTSLTTIYSGRGIYHLTSLKCNSEIYRVEVLLISIENK